LNLQKESKAAYNTWLLILSPSTTHYSLLVTLSFNAVLKQSSLKAEKTTSYIFHSRFFPAFPALQLLENIPQHASRSAETLVVSR
jgi:hypothetical protein